MIKVGVYAITAAYGCGVYTTIEIQEDYTMHQFVEAVKANGFRAFMILGTMKRIVYIQ